jgi:hypothetical protein
VLGQDGDHDGRVFRALAFVDRRGVGLLRLRSHGIADCSNFEHAFGRRRKAEKARASPCEPLYRLGTQETVCIGDYAYSYQYAAFPF